MDMGDLPFLPAVFVGAALVSVFAFFVALLLTRNLRILKAASGLAAPLLIATLAIGIEVWNADPHGWVLTGLLVLAAICLPVTLSLSDFLVRHFAERGQSKSKVDG